MCGIVLMLGKHHEERERRMREALDTIQHRGLPGRQGTFINDYVAMGHVRLPIRGLGIQYDQPMQTADYTGVFVGEIFGIDKVNDAQYAFELLNSEGLEALARHDGFWSIAWYDSWNGTTQVITDHLAIKPLYWNMEEGIIASELRAVVNLSERLTLNQHYLSNVRKWGYDPSNRTPYNEVVRMDAGSCYSFNRSGSLIGIWKYFKLEPQNFNIRDEIETAVANRLVGDVPVASMCSGGLDSTIVSLLATQYLKKMTVFHVDAGSEDTAYFETINWPSWVQVERLVLPEYIEQGDLVEAWDAQEEPVDLGSVVPQFQLGRAVQAAGFNVVLSGDGADELFGGYRRAQEYDSQYSDIFSELVHYHLPRIDKCMMASTVELRSPFLAPRVVQAALALPYDQRTTKQALKLAFSDIVPMRILYRPKVPLKTQTVIQGGQQYREKVIQNFIKRMT